LPFKLVRNLLAINWEIGKLPSFENVLTFRKANFHNKKMQALPAFNSYYF